MWLMLQDLESRLLLATTQLIMPLLASPLTSVGAAAPAIKITLADQFGAQQTADTSTVVLTLASNPSGGSLTTYTNGSWRAVGSVTVSASGGIATFSNISFSVPGQYMINANSGSTAGTQSNFFTVLPAATHLVFNVQPGNITAGNTFSPVVQVYVEDASNNLVATDTRAISLSLNTTTGQMTGGTLTNAQNGIATFTGLSVTTAGTFTITARDTSAGGLNAITSASFTVSAGAAAALRFEQQPTNTPQGETFGALVSVRDSLGNLVNVDGASITLSVASPFGTPLGGTTTRLVSGGTASFFGLFINQPGDYTLKAVSGTLSVTSASFAIIGEPAKLAFIGLPSQTTVGHIMSPGVVVAVEDVGSHIVINDSSTITLTVVGPGNLLGTTTLQVTNGTASFNDLSFSAMGTYALVANDGLLTGATSNSFIINGTAAQLAFLVQPSAPSANSPIVPPVVIEVEDIAGNRVVDASNMVVISLDSGPGLLGGVTQVTSVNGSASFSSLRLTLSGTYTLAANSSGLSGVISDPFVVLPAASRVVFVTQPMNVATGSAMYPAVVVQIQNDLGQVATTNTSSVTLAILDGPDNGSIGGTTTVAAVAGVATFSNLQFAVKGQYTLVAYDGSLAADTSDTFKVTTSPTKLQWGVQPQYTVTAGDTMNPFTMFVKTKNGDIVGSSHVVVTLTISSGPTGGSLSLNGRAVANATTNAMGGVATFSNISFTKVGTYILNAAGSGLTATKSKAFVVLADADSAHVVLGQGVSTSLVGRNFTSNVMINIADQFGNILADNSQVSLLLQGSTSGVFSGTTTVNAVNGVATFSGLSVNQIGSYVVMAYDPSLPNATPTTFSLTVTPVISSVNKPSTDAVYTVGGEFTLSTKLRGLLSSNAPWAGTMSLVTDGGVLLPTTSEIETTGDAKLYVAGLTAGTYTVRARYDGDENHVGGSSALFNLSVGPTTTTTLTAPKGPIAGGSSLTLNVQVSAGNATTVRTGMLQLVDNGVVIATQSLDASSSAVFSVEPENGSHTYTVTYPGDINFRGSVSSAATVAVGLTTTTSATAASSLHVGDTLTLGVQVGTSGTAPVARTGEVQILENGILIMSGTLSASAQVFTFTPSRGKHVYTVAYPGDTVYRGSSTNVTFTVGREATTTAVTAAPSGPQLTVGAVLTINATVTANNATTVARTGVLALKDGNTTLTTLNLEGSSSATFNFTPTAGAHAYTVVYLGDNNFSSSTSAKLNVTAVRATTVVATSASAIALGQAFQLGVQVAPLDASAFRTKPTGKVRLYENGAVIKTLSLNRSGGGTFAFTPTAGTHTYTVVYQGDSNYAASAPSVVNLTVAAPPAATVTVATSTLAGTQNSFGTVLKIDAQVNSPNPGSSLPSGTVTLLDNNGTSSSTLGTQTLNAYSSAEFTVTDAAVGRHTYTVIYSGDANYTTSTSNVISLGFVKEGTTTSVLPSTTDLAAGGTLYLDTSVSALNETTIARSGSVQLLEGTTVVGSVTLASSVATFTLSPTAGTHTYTVAYLGGSGFLTSTSSSVTVGVGLTNTTFTTNTTTVYSGDALTITATVSPSAAGNVALTGNVQLLDNGLAIASQTLNASAQAEFTVHPMAGKHVYSVTYGGTTQFAVSTSDVLDIIVAPEATTTLLTPSATTGTAGTIFTIGVQVNANNAATDTRTGVVALEEDGTVIAALHLNSSSAGVFTLTPAVGSHTYTVVYLGDGNFLSNELDVTVTVTPEV
jgi:hypothetical protein